MSVSFRDPSGILFLHQEQIFRLINQTGQDDFNCALRSDKLKSFLDLGNLVNVSQIEIGEVESLKEIAQNKFEISPEKISSIVTHEKISFVSYPYEWTPEMLYAAGVLTLDLAETIQKEGLGLKDATPFNILFRRAKPVFVDWLSFEKRDPHDPIWLPQAQFIRTFCLPLMVNKYFGHSLNSIFCTNRDGLEPETVYQMLSLTKKLLPPFLSLVSIPQWLSKKGNSDSAIYEKKTVDNPEKAEFVLSQQFKSLRHRLQKLKPGTEKYSNWTEYIGEKQHFTNRYLQHKEQFVANAMKSFTPKNVLDVGCNNGHFSRIAAQNGADIVAIDQDPAVVGKVWQMAEKEGLKILPLVVDISRPTPAIGWRNSESASFLDRVRGKMDVVMMLAVIHHLLVTERIPLSQIIELVAEITTNIAIIEFVPPEDPMFKQIARGRDQLFQDLNSTVFREICQKHFKVLQSEKLADSDRELYLLQK